MIVLRALSALLSYPRDDLRDALPEIARNARPKRELRNR